MNIIIKGVSQKKHNVIIHILERKHQKELNRKAKAKVVRKCKQIQMMNNKKGDKKPEHQKVHKVIQLPKVFDLHDNHEEVMEKINMFRKSFNNFAINPHIRIDFSKIEEITLASALVLAADIDAWRITKRPSSVDLPQKVIVLFDKLGFFELLEIPRDGNDNTQEIGFSCVKLLSAQKTDGEKAKKLREGIEKTMGQELQLNQSQALFHSLTEALTNAKQHAYTKPNDLKEYEKWWITAACGSVPGSVSGSVSGSDKELTVAIYDRGRTIPKTMAKTWFLDRMKEAIGNDAKLISVAMKTSYSGVRHRSKTKEKHRGKGLKQLLDMVNLETGGTVHIISGRGYCCFGVENGELVTHFERNQKLSMHGTLIEWRIRL